MRSLRASGHLLQFLPKPPLSEVPDQRSGEVVVRSATGTVAGMLLPPGLQRTACVGAVNMAKQEAPVRPLVRCQCCHAAGSRSRSISPRRGDRLPQYPAYVGTDFAAPPAHPLRRARWRTVAGSLALDPLPAQLLPAGESAQPRLSREVRRRIAAGVS